MDMRPDPFESRLDKLSMKYLYAPNGVRMKSWQPSQVGAVLQSESNLRESFSLSVFCSLRESFSLLVFSLVPKQNKSARVSMV